MYRIDRSKQNYLRFQKELLQTTESILVLVTKYFDYIHPAQQKRLTKFKRNLRNQLEKLSKSYEKYHGYDLSYNLGTINYPILTDRCTRYEMITDANTILDLQKQLNNLFCHNCPLGKTEVIRRNI